MISQNKVDFAELKEKLCEFDYNENDMCSQASKKYGTGPINGAYKDGYISSYESAHTKSSAIISELIEIIKSQSEALESYAFRTQSHAVSTVVARNSIDQTNTRLQKLINKGPQMYIDQEKLNRLVEKLKSNNELLTKLSMALFQINVGNEQRKQEALDVIAEITKETEDVP